MMISGESLVVRAGELDSTDLAGEVVIFNRKSKMYYGLNAMGGRVWGLLETSHTVTALRDALVAEFGVAAEQCEQDLLTLLQQLEKEGLIEVK
jgi:hypothetical protein